ncbi:MAG: hypothetical protein R2771_08535 [Saprospiraceae bacterium]
MGSGAGNDFLITKHDFTNTNDPLSNLKRVRYGDETDPLSGITTGISFTQGQEIGKVVAASNVHLHFEM